MKNKNIEQYNSNNQRYGYWEIYWGKFMYKCYYINGILNGYFEETTFDSIGSKHTIEVIFHI